MRSIRPIRHKRLALFTAAILVTGLTGAAGAIPGVHGHKQVRNPASALAHMSPDFVPPADLVQQLTQPDGTRFSARMSPATQGGLMETTSGYSVAKDKGGVWRYVTGRAKDGTVQLSSEAVGSGKRPDGVQQHAGRRTTKVDPQEAQARADMQRQLQIASRQAQMAAAAAGEPRLFKVPAILFATWWDPSKGQTSPQFQPGTDEPKYFADLLTGFGGNPQGSVTQFYYESSFGQFLVEIDVYGPYISTRSVQDRCYYGGIGQEPENFPVLPLPNPIADGDLDPLDTTLGVAGGGALGMALEVVGNPLAQAQVPWNEYDNDGNGEVDFTMIIHSGADMATTGDPCNTWSHALQATLGQGETAEAAAGLPPGSLSRVGLPTGKGVTIDRVLTMPEFASPGHPLTIGVAAHEMAHSLGEPDYYDVSYQSNGLGDFDIMAGGSYLGNPAGSDPTIFHPASRVFQGWVTPKVVQGNLRDYKLKPRTLLPKEGYHVGQPDPNMLLVPTYEIAVGETDKLGHTWVDTDVYGLAKNPKTGKYIVEGFYVENVNRMVVAPPIDPRNTRSAMFDRKSHGSGLIVWHFDYWRQSNVYFNSNNAQSDANRYQMDVEEFDQNDNTQELQLAYTRGNASEYLIGAATGITSGTRRLAPGVPKSGGEPQGPIDISGTVAPLSTDEAPFTVENNSNNELMTVTAGSDNPAGDCKLQLVDPEGKAGPQVDPGGAGAAETLQVKNPIPGEWTARVSDFAACLQWSGRVVFEGPGGFSTLGAADTWSNWSEKPTGWAFTNVSHGDGNGLDGSQDAGGSENVTLDVVNLKGKRDVSPGFVAAKENDNNGRGSINVGRDNKMSVPVFSNGSKSAKNVVVEVRRNSKTGPLVARKTVDLDGYDRKNVNFEFNPSKEGVFRLYTRIDRGDSVGEAIEDNNVQLSEGWAGPRNPSVLVVDDDDVLTGQRAVQGALAALGVPYATAWKHPTAAQLKKYDVVIWEAHVDRYEGQLNKVDRAALRSYLNDGGNLLMSSNRVFDALGGGPSDSSPLSTVEGVEFGAQYLGSRLPNSTYVVSQESPGVVTGKGLLDGIKANISPGNGRPFDGLAGLAQAGPSSQGNVIKPFGTAKGIATLDKNSMVAVQPAADTPYIGIQVDGDAKHNKFKTVTLGYNLAQNRSQDDTVRIVRKVLKHFDVRLHRYTVETKEPVVYHPTVRDQVSGRDTPVTATVLGGDGSEPVTLFYRRHGQGGFYSVKMQKGDEPGAYGATIPGKAVTPDGVDYFIKAGTGSTFDPYLARDRKQFHAIGVQLPELAHPVRVLSGGSGGGGGGNGGGGNGTDQDNRGGGGSLATTGMPAAVAIIALTLLLVAGVLRARRRSLGE